MRAAEVIERFNDTVIGTQRQRCKTRQRRTVVVGFVELRVFVDGASKETSIERTVGDEPDAEFLQHGEHFGFRFAPHEVVFALDGRERTFSVGSADCVRADFAHAEVLDFAFFDEVGNGAGNVFGGDGGVEAVLVEEVNGFNAEIFQRLFANATDVFRAAVELPFDLFFVFVKNKAEFGGDLNTILKGRNCFAHKFFVFSADASIDLGGVKKN